MTPGQSIDDRFRIVGEAGAGGMGKVYRAFDEMTGRAVAVKVLHRWAGGNGVLGERFALEARLLASLEHPGIVQHVAHGMTESGERYLAMEWIEGTTLAARLGSAPALTLLESITLVLHLAVALATAHLQGVVHRDLKPANVMLVGGNVGRPSLLDFGIARADGALQLTQTGAVL